jgi:hypothetical protein
MNQEGCGSMWSWPSLNASFISVSFKARNGQENVIKEGEVL